MASQRMFTTSVETSSAAPAAGILDDDLQREDPELADMLARDRNGRIALIFAMFVFIASTIASVVWHPVWTFIGFGLALPFGIIGAQRNNLLAKIG